MTERARVELTMDGPFRAIYEQPGQYDEILLRHFFRGREDTDLISDWMVSTFGQPPQTREAAAGLRVLEFGCGTGRLTERTAPYASSILGVDYSPVMTEAFIQRFPTARSMCADTRDAVPALLSQGLTGRFDLVSAFWSLSYPLGAYFESLDASGLRPVEDLGRARRGVADLVTGLVDLTAPGGHLVAMLFDADSPEQQLVTWAWERVAPTPFGERSYSRNLLLQGLLASEAAGCGTLTTTRLPGIAVARDAVEAMRWFTAAHFKNLRQLTGDAEVIAAVNRFITLATGPDGTVLLPAGVHLIDFHRGDTTHAHLPVGGL